MPDTCPNCSAPLDADAIFCASCAAPVTPQCPSCGKSVNANTKYCKYCAFDLTQKTPVANVEKPSVAASTPTVSPKTPTLLPKLQSISETDALLADKYHAMSDSQLLAMLGGDLSGQTEESLAIALAELETRTNIDWRDMSIAKTHVKEAIVAARKYGGEQKRSTFTTPESRALSGIGGWLIFPAIGLVISPLMSIGYLLLTIFMLNGSFGRELELENPGFRTALVGDAIMGVAFLCFQIYVARLFFNKSRKLPKMMVILFAVNIVLTFINVMWTSSVLKVPIDIKEVIRAAALACVWIPYFCVSKRVKATFIN